MRFSFDHTVALFYLDQFGDTELLIEPTVLESYQVAAWSGEVKDDDWRQLQDTEVTSEAILSTAKEAICFDGDWSETYHIKEENT